MRASLSSLALLSVVVGAVVQSLGGGTAAGLAAAAALLLYVLLEGWAARSNSRIILGMAALAGLASLWHADPLGLLERAATASAALIGLFVALGFLREAAETSDLVRRCGELMVRQPPGRRYMVLSVGSHLIALVLNFGVLPLLGSMVMRGNTAEAAGGDPRIVAIRSRRMLSAMLRGFALMTAWSPLSVSFAVTSVALPGLAWHGLLAAQVVLAVILLLFGWVLDRRAFPPSGRVLPGVGEPTDWGPALRMALLVASVVAGSMAVALIIDVRLVVGAMLVVPASAVAWLLVQQGDPLRVAQDLRRRLRVSLPAFRDEVAMLGGAMFLGTVAAAFLSADLVGHFIDGLGLPAIVLVILLAWTMMILAQLGISQIVSTTLFAGALSHMGAHAAPPLVVASGLMGAWALSACSTPVGAAVLTVARVGGVSVGTVAREWNGGFVIGGALLLALWLLALHGLLAVFR